VRFRLLQISFRTGTCGCQRAAAFRATEKQNMSKLLVNFHLALPVINPRLQSFFPRAQCPPYVRGRIASQSTPYLPSCAPADKVQLKPDGISTPSNGTIVRTLYCIASLSRCEGPGPMPRQTLGSLKNAPEDVPAKADGKRKPRAHKTSNRVLSFKRHEVPCKETLESILSSAFRSEDRELDQILHALEDLSDIVKSNKLDPEAVDDALKRAAVWAVEKSLLDREVRSLAITDDLTGFFNRRGFLASASQQLKLAQRDRLSVLLLFCDVDNLKAINDSLGHQEGDLVIVRAADALEETFRDSDLLARLGGDEFAILVWEASIPNLRIMLSRLASNLDKVNAEESRYKLSLSVGVAKYDPQFPLSLGELMASADQDMYKHKKLRTFAASSSS
jgi:diguanylate cyclase (GGDEF)-like protein